MKYLSIDLGEKRIGMAISDQNGIIAEPLDIIHRTSDKQAISEINDICKERSVDCIVMGLPLSAQEGTVSRFKSFAQKLKKKTNVPLKYWDETFSTKRAQNVVAFADSPGGRKRTKTHRDAVAASIILQEFLDNENSRKDNKPDYP